MNRVSLCLAYYENPGMLHRQYAEWANYPKEIKAHLEVIVVDDGSPRAPADRVPRPKGLPALKLFRMRQDVRWCQDACRNLAVDHAESPWVLLTDMDHVVPEQTIGRIVAGKLKASNVYKFARVSAPNLQPYKDHPNSWLMTRNFYQLIGGYEEAFCGYYGTDGQFRDSVMAGLKARPGSIERLAEPLIRVPREVIKDASTQPEFGRKSPEDGDAIRRIKAELAERGDRRPSRRGFEWDRLL